MNWISQFIEEDIYLVDTTDSARSNIEKRLQPAEETPTFKIGVCPIINDPTELELLAKILTAIGVSQNEYALREEIDNCSQNWLVLSSSKSKTMGLNVFEIHQIENKTIICSVGLDELQKSVQNKQALWKALQTFKAQ